LLGLLGLERLLKIALDLLARRLAVDLTGFLVDGLLAAL
jgi:hypothetical protein